ncbi:MAG: dethiobiotin synthase, partial [Proteobacteria bacterium]|nr:dethiobiotin synthase [Burkholderiales bacterium]
LRVGVLKPIASGAANWRAWAENDTQDRDQSRFVAARDDGKPGRPDACSDIAIRQALDAWDDIASACASANVRLPAQWLNQYRFAAPIAPHLAAADAGVQIRLAPIVDAVERAARAVDWLLIEGVGGFRVPLAGGANPVDTAELARVLGFPVLLVVGLRLGCINHALLTAESIGTRGLPFAAWVANTIDPAFERADDTVATLEQWLPAPRVGYLAHAPIPDWPLSISQLDLATLATRVPSV